MCVAYNYRPKLARDEINCQISNSTSQKDVKVFAKGEWILHQDLETFCSCEENLSLGETFKNLCKEQNITFHCYHDKMERTCQRGIYFSIYISAHIKCLSVSSNDIVVGKPCEPNDAKQKWSWINGGNQLINKNSNKCLDVEGEIKFKSKVRVSCCDNSVPGQRWSCSEDFILVGGTIFRLYLGTKCQLYKACLGNNNGTWNHWKIFGTTENICTAKPLGNS
ncbi:macrophage mannose receptor 1-like [Dendronephthya gigantea]|uniref:macrophage mannose receptor 1-like n=1 Tax=Dendronephthya gigantea TaxID=151771 RepID=UPI00106D7270|nr:macrophage mannose receptor 1-like [Dendronephthya gigantea]